MSENTRLDIDSNIPQEMDKIGKAADRAAKKISNVGSGSALEELQRMMKSVEREFKNFGGTADNAFDKALKNLSKSSMPDSVRDVYRNALILAKEGRRKLEAEYANLGSESEKAAKRVAAAQAKIAKAEPEGKTSIGAQKELKTASNILASLEGKFADARENAKNLKLFHLQLRDALNKEYNEFYLKRQATQKTADLAELQAFKDLGVKLIGEDAVLYKRLTESAKTAANLEKDQYQKKLESMASAQKEADTRFEAMRKDSLNRGKSLILQAAKDDAAALAAADKTAAAAELARYRQKLESMASAQKDYNARLAAMRKDSLDRGEVLILQAAKNNVFTPKPSSIPAEMAGKDQEFINRYRNATEDLVSMNDRRAKSLVQYLDVVKATAEKSAEYANKKYGTAAVSFATGPEFDALKVKLGATGKQLPGLSAGFRKLGDDMGYAHSFARGLASGFNLLWLTWGKLEPLFAGASISYGVAKTFEFGSEIEYNIRFLETLGDMTRTQGKVIREELRKMDESTTFSMKELASTMISLGQAGISAKDSLLLTKTSADLATVGMTDMATSTDLLMQVTKLFGMTAADADKIASQLYEATKVSSMNISDLGASFKYASIAGLAYNQTLEGTLAGYAALSEGGITKSMAGTSFINLLQDLTGRSKKSIDAMEMLRKKTGETIAIYDDTGKMRNFADIVFEIDKAVKMFDPKKQKKLVNDIFTERGIREYFALIGVGKEKVDALYRSLEKVDPKKAFNAALNLQDTVKAGFDMTMSTLTSSLDRVFEANSGKFREFFTGMTEIIGSKEFINSVNLMVNAFSGLYETLKVVGPALLVVGGGFLAMKSVAMVQTGVASLTATLGTLIPVLAQSRGSFLTLASSSIASATAVQGQGLALLQTGVMARGAAGGIEAAAVASALTATSATKAVPAIRALAIVMGFLTNPIVGVITTLGILGATWWATSRDSMTASEQLSSKVVENGKVNVKALDEEIKKLLERNAIVAENNPIGSMAYDAKAEADKAYSAMVKTQEALLTAPTELIAKGLRSKLKAEREAYTVAADNAKSLAEGAEKYRKDREAQEAKDSAARAARLKAEQEKAAKPPGTLDPNTSDGGTASNRSFDQYASSLTRQLAALKSKTAKEKQTAQARMTETEALYKREIDLVEAKNKAGMLSEGEYQVAVIRSTQQAEAAKLSLLEEAKKKVSDANLAELAQQEKIQGKALSDFKGSKEARQDLVDSYAEKIEAIQKQEVADTATYNAEIEKLKQESLFRIENATIEHQGKLIKLQKEADKYLADLKGERSKEAAVAALNKQYENVNDSSVIWLQAEKAAATASAEAVGKHEAQLRGMTLEYEKVAEAASALAEADRKLAAEGYVLPELSTAAGQMEEQRKALETSIGEFRKQINQDVADQAAIAYNESFRKRSSEFKNTVAQSLADAMFAGAENGSKSLRKILEAELKAPFVLLFRMSIDALMGDLGKAAGSTGGTGSSGLSGALSGLSAASTLNTAYKALSGAIEGSIGKSFEKFATSSFGETLGLSQSSNAGYALPSDLAGTMGGNMSELTDVADGLSEASDAFTSATSEMTSLGKTFTDVGTGMAAAFAGQAARKGLSGGYRTGNALESTMDVASIAAGFVPVIGPVTQLVTGAVSGLVSRAFGRKVKDTGIQGSFGNQGFSGENYTFEKGGWFRSNRTRTSALDQSTTNTFTNTFKSIQASTAVLATNIGLSAQAAVDFRKDIKLSLKGLSAEEQSTALTKMFTDMQEEMATSVLNAWGDWSVIAKYGETASQVLTNVSNNLTGFNGMLDMLDLRLITLSVTGAAAASSIIEAAGGVDALTGMYSSYYENFYSEVERNGKSIETLREKFSALGVTMPALAVDAEGFVTNGDKARETFRGLVTAAADAGNITLATELVKLSSTFAEVTPLAEKFLKGLKDETKALNAELLKAQGNLAGYSAALRAIETVGMTEVEAATYDYNQTLAKHIELLGQADEARATATAAEIKLLQAQGNETAALAKQRELDIKGLSEAQVAAYDYSAAIDKQVTAMEKLSEAKDSATASDIKLLQAQGREVEALAKQRELDIRSMTQAEIAAYDYNQAIDEQVSKLENAADIVSKFGDVSGNLRDYLAGFAEDSSTLFETTVRESLSGSFEAMGRVAQDADKAIEKAKASSRSSAEFSLKQANILAQVGSVKAYADTMSKETDTDKIIAAIKGETTTSKEVTGLGTRLSSQDLAVSLNATLSAVKKTASANLDIAAISSMFDSMFASVTEMSLTEQASAEGQSLLKMFDDMSASVLYISMDAPISEVDKVTKVFSSLTAFVKKVSAEGLPAGSVQAALGAAAEVAAAIKTISATGLKSGSAQLALSSLANITSYITEIDVKKGNTLSAQFASELAAYSSISANISKIVTAPNIVEERKKSLVTTLSTIAATINAVNVNAAIPEARKVALNSVFSNLSSSITSVNVNAAIPEARKVALNAIFSNLLSNISTVSVSYGIVEDRRAQMLQSLSYLGAVIGYITTAPNLVPKTVDSIADSLDSFQAVITKVAISSQDSNLKSLLLGNISEVSYGLSISSAIAAGMGSFGLSASQTKELLSSSEIIKSIAVSAGTDGTLTAAQQEAYANASDSITKAVSVVRGTDATNLTEAQKTLLGILGGTSDGQVTVGGSVDYAPSNELDNLFEGLTTALGKVGIQEMTAALGQLVSAIDQQLAADAAAKAAADKQRAIADAQVAGAKVKARQNSAIQGVNTAISEVWQHASNAGVWLNKDAGATLKANTYEIKVNDSGLLEYTSWGQTTYRKIQGVVDFNAAYRAGDLSNRTYGQAGTLQNLASELEAARQQVRNLGGVPEFATGGYTGPGKVNDVAGIVHKGEVVWSQSDIAKAGGLSVVEAMRAGFMPYTQDIPAPAITYSGAQSTIGFDDSALLQELQALREEVSSMRYEVRATAVNTGKSAKNLKEFYDRGIKVKNSETGPLETAVV